MDNRSALKKIWQKTARYLIMGVIFLWSAFAFRLELGVIGNALQSIPSLIRGEDTVPSLALENALAVIIFLLFYISTLVFIYWFFTYSISRSLLPAKYSFEWREIMKRFRRFVLGEKFPLVIVQDGKIVKGEDAGKKLDNGILIVDISSAAVLERKKNESRHKPEKMVDRTKESFVSTVPKTRVVGPGYVFTDKGEKLRDVVNLRNQFRRSQSIQALTSDGVVIETNISVVFSLAQPPFVIKVAYCGEGPDGLCELQVNQESREITAIIEDIDPADRLEIHQYAQHFLRTVGETEAFLPAETIKEYPPYHFDARRIQAAVYSEGYKSGEPSSEITWMDLPVQEATKVFRDLLSQVAYDDLYKATEGGGILLHNHFRPKFSRTVRNRGVLAYQFVHRQDGKFPKVGQRITYRDFRISSMQILQTSQVLRDQGVRVITAGFSDLKPQEGVLQQKLNEWRSKFIQDQTIGRGIHELEVARAVEQARLERGKDLILKLEQLLNRRGRTRESALLTAILQNLDQLANEAEVQRLIPRETLNTIRDIRIWTISDEK